MNENCGARMARVVDKNPGCVRYVEVVLRFGRWADGLRRVPMPEEISEKFCVSRATAYRWLDSYKATRGVA